MSPPLRLGALAVVEGNDAIVGEPADDRFADASGHGEGAHAGELFQGVSNGRALGSAPRAVGAYGVR